MAKKPVKSKPVKKLKLKGFPSGDEIIAALGKLGITQVLGSFSNEYENSWTTIAMNLTKQDVYEATHYIERSVADGVESNVIN